MMKDSINTCFREYKSGMTTRRDFLRKLTLFTGSASAAATLLLSAEQDLFADTNSAALPGDKPGETLPVTTEMIVYQGTSPINAYLAKPGRKKKYPAVVVIHENRGLQPHIKEVTQRMASAGFLALAPDALSPLGGTPENDGNKAVSMIQSLNMDDTIKNFVAAVKYLQTHPMSTGKVGCTGFCWGGAMTNMVAVNSSGLLAAVPYYGRQPSAEDTAKIKSAVLAHYASDDSRINEGIPAFEEALKKAGIDYKIYMYEGTKHGFNNDSNPERYNEQAAKRAWERTVEFFREKLK